MQVDCVVTKAFMACTCHWRVTGVLLACTCHWHVTGVRVSRQVVCDSDEAVTILRLSTECSVAVHTTMHSCIRK